MKLAQIQPKFKVIIAVAIVLFLGLIVVLFSSFGKPKSSVLEKNPTPTIDPQKFIPPKNLREVKTPNVQKIRQDLIQGAASKNGEKVVYETDGFRIIYVPTPDIFFAQIFKDPAQNYRQQAQEWLAQKGLSQNDICTLPLRLLLFDPSLKKTNPGFNYFPDNCS